MAVKVLTGKLTHFGVSSLILLVSEYKCNTFINSLCDIVHYQALNSQNLGWSRSVQNYVKYSFIKGKQHSSQAEVLAVISLKL